MSGGRTIMRSYKDMRLLRRRPRMLRPRPDRDLHESLHHLRQLRRRV